MFSSIRSKITLWYTVALALVIFTFSAVIYLSLVGVLRAETDENLSGMADNFITAAISDQGDEDAKPDAVENIVETIDAFRFQDFQFAVVAQDGGLVAKTTEFDLPVSLKNPKTSVLFEDLLLNDESYRVFHHSFQIGPDRFHLIVLHPLADRVTLEGRLRDVILIAIPVALLLAGLGGYFLVRRSLGPIPAMNEHARLITSQNLHERLPVANENDELGQLATVFNDLLDRLDKSFEQQRRFMADASHELRTPLAIIRGESEVAISKSTRTAVHYQESLAIVNDESKRLTRIVEDLFTLARADAGKYSATFTDVYIDEIAAECAHSIRTLAQKRDITMTVHSEETLVRGDESLLRRLILNLLDNAVKYNHAEGRISVKIRDKQVSVTNTGPEIPVEERSQIFERFFRADKSRERQNETSTSGAGLGLSISNWIAELHGARLELTKSQDGKNTFSLIF